MRLDHRPRTALRRLVALVVLIGALSLAVTAPASASTYPPPDPILSVSNGTILVSGPLTGTVTGCTPGEQVTFSFPGNDPITTTCDPNGVATATFTAPPTPGLYDITAVLEDGTTLRITVTVVASGPLPDTGSDGVSSLLLFAAGLVVFGALFLAVVHLRRRQPDPVPA